MTGEDADTVRDPLRIEVRRGTPTAEELAAVLAVVSEAYEVEAASAIADPEPHVSAWQISARAVRSPLRRDVGWTAHTDL